MAEKKVYFNKPQRLTQLIGANTTVIVAGRCTGKTDSIAALFVLRNMQRMPGSTGGIVVPTFKHGLTNTIPGLLAAWKRWGFHQGHTLRCREETAEVVPSTHHRPERL